jgi:hypothetical protein
LKFNRTVVGFAGGDEDDEPLGFGLGLGFVLVGGGAEGDLDGVVEGVVDRVGDGEAESEGDGEVVVWTTSSPLLSFPSARFTPTGIAMATAANAATIAPARWRERMRLACFIAESVRSYAEGTRPAWR